MCVCVCVCGGVGKNHQANVLTYQKVAKMKQQMKGIGKVIEWEVSISLSASAQSAEVKMQEGAKADTTLSREPSKSERSANLPPCLALGQAK